MPKPRSRIEKFKAEREEAKEGIQIIDDMEKKVDIYLDHDLNGDKKLKKKVKKYVSSRPPEERGNLMLHLYLKEEYRVPCLEEIKKEIERKKISNEDSQEAGAAIKEYLEKTPLDMYSQKFSSIMNTEFPAAVGSNKPGLSKDFFEDLSLTSLRNDTHLTPLRFLNFLKLMKKENNTEELLSTLTSFSPNNAIAALAGIFSKDDVPTCLKELSTINFLKNRPNAKEELTKLISSDKVSSSVPTSAKEIIGEKKQESNLLEKKLLLPPQVHREEFPKILSEDQVRTIRTCLDLPSLGPLTLIKDDKASLTFQNEGEQRFVLPRKHVLAFVDDRTTFGSNLATSLKERKALSFFVSKPKENSIMPKINCRNTKPSNEELEEGSKFAENFLNFIGGDLEVTNGGHTFFTAKMKDTKKPSYNFEVQAVQQLDETTAHHGASTSLTKHKKLPFNKNEIVSIRFDPQHTQLEFGDWSIAPNGRINITVPERKQTKGR